LKIRFIGTGSGKTSLNRFHSSIMISVSDYNLLIDSGDGVSRALFTQGIPFNSINGLLISHLHPDHFSGFAGLIVQMKMSKRKEPLYIFVHHTLIKTLKDFLTISYVFMGKMDFSLHFVGFNFESEVLISSDFSFIALKNTHLDEYINNNPSLSYACGSFLFKSKNKNVFYSGDIGSADDLYLFKDHRIDIFITEAEHISVGNILSASDELKPGKVILTHLSDENTVLVKKNIKKTQNESVIVAEDGLLLNI
jgi:ribonuclease Z